MKDLDISEQLALAKLAYETDIFTVEEFAKKKGIDFERERAVKYISLIYGEKEAREARFLWLDIQEDSKKLLERIKSKTASTTTNSRPISTVKTKTKQMLDFLKSKLDSFTHSLKYTYEEMNNINYGAVSLRNNAESATENDVKVVPKLSIFGDKITVRLSVNNNLKASSLPHEKSKYILFIDKEYVEDFELKDKNDYVAIKSRVPEGFSTEQPCSIKYDDDLDLIAIFIGEEPDLVANDDSNEHGEIIKFIESLPNKQDLSDNAKEYLNQLQIAANDESFKFRGAAADSAVSPQQWLRLTAKEVDGSAFVKIIDNKYYVFKLTLNVGDEKHNTVNLIQFTGEEILVFDLSLDFDEEVIMSSTGKKVGTVWLENGKLSLTVDKEEVRLDGSDCEKIIYSGNIPSVLLSVKYGGKLYSFNEPTNDS